MKGPVLSLAIAIILLLVATKPASSVQVDCDPAKTVDFSDYIHEAASKLGANDIVRHVFQFKDTSKPYASVNNQLSKNKNIIYSIEVCFNGDTKLNLQDKSAAPRNNIRTYYVGETGSSFNKAKFRSGRYKDNGELKKKFKKAYTEDLDDLHVKTLTIYSLPFDFTVAGLDELVMAYATIALTKIRNILPSPVTFFNARNFPLTDYTTSIHKDMTEAWAKKQTENGQAIVDEWKATDDVIAAKKDVASAVILFEVDHNLKLRSNK